ncbi:MAG: YHS domain protein [Bacteroidetes bacterium]|nr:YHS domain protein [Bacteroidota bacterium]
MKANFLLAGFLLLTTLSVTAQDLTTVRKNHFNTNSDYVGIKGYDPVAYFTANTAIKGNKELAVYHQGITYYFSSVANKESFKKNPSMYEPAYGGWCAYAMGAKGDKVSIDPETFKIVNGKLYLFYNKNFNNTLKSWNKDENQLKLNADNNWKSIFK